MAKADLHMIFTPSAHADHARQLIGHEANRPFGMMLLILLNGRWFRPRTGAGNYHSAVKPPGVRRRCGGRRPH